MFYGTVYRARGRRGNHPYGSCDGAVQGSRRDMDAPAHITHRVAHFTAPCHGTTGRPQRARARRTPAHNTRTPEYCGMWSERGADCAHHANMIRRLFPSGQ
eukprot:7366463-Prymnesium_polylepis.1